MSHPTHTLKINDRVLHFYFPTLTGVITGTMLSEEVDEDMDPGEPWYQIEWDNNEDEITGREHQDSLIKI